jgi:hypothetical protein
MANLATATSADRETVATLTQAIATLTDQLKAKDIWVKSQEAEVRRLLGVQGNTRLAAATSTPTTYVRKSYRTNNDNYCWSHGYQVHVYEQKSTQDTITYLHACCFSAVTDMWLKSIKNCHFAT